MHCTFPFICRTVLSAAGLGGICYWMVIFPVDCIKSAMQTDTITRAQRKYTDIPTTAKVCVAAVGAAANSLQTL